MKLIDFGLGITESQRTKSAPLCGSPGYIAPELFVRGCGSFESDIYSCGIVLYFILSGELPFPGTETKVVLSCNKRNDIKFTGPIWARISTEAKSLISAMTHSDPDMRPTASEALDHAWFHKILGKPAIPVPEPVESTTESSEMAYSCNSALARSIASGFTGSVLKEIGELHEKPAVTAAVEATTKKPVSSRQLHKPPSFEPLVKREENPLKDCPTPGTADSVLPRPKAKVTAFHNDLELSKTTKPSSEVKGLPRRSKHVPPRSNTSELAELDNSHGLQKAVSGCLKIHKKSLFAYGAGQDLEAGQ